MADLSTNRTVTVVTWNLNSIRSRLTHLLDYLDAYAPDIVLLQEIKVETEAFPAMEIEDKGYHLAVHGQKTYNGVAILSKYPLEDVVTQLPGDAADEQARYSEAVVCLPDTALRVASVYVPNGQSPDSDKFSYKMRFFERLQAHARRLLEYEEILVIGGDYNVAPAPVDVYDPQSLDGTVCYHPREREHFRRLLHPGFYDAFRVMQPTQQAFSWWDYRGNGWAQNKGMRIDHLLLSPEAADCLADCVMHEKERGREKPSDHIPVMATLEI